MVPTTVKWGSALVLLSILAAGCSFGPPPSCGDNIGGVADTALFDQYFHSMVLVSQTTGEPGLEGNDGAQFAQGDPLVIRTDAKSEVAVRACVQGRDEIPLDQTQTVPLGPGEFPIGSYSTGGYVVRVIVDGTLLKNFPFYTE
jgi:hypothetical protein